ncbi:peptide deformylase [Corynebacterium variabile]|uniref:peptide deformylase n=1 Tax=Corynebacterium variabile TaxID=1727 RepID=UPI003A91E577
MSVLPVYICGETLLRTPTTPVTNPHSVRGLVDDLHETLARIPQGTSLTANQVGIGLSVFVYHCPDIEGPRGTRKTAEEIDAQGGPRRKGYVINPTIETSPIPQTMPDEASDRETCLSMPGLVMPRGRADWARVNGIDTSGDTIIVEGYGFFARCLQHSVEHLQGQLFTDGLVGHYRRDAKRDIKSRFWTTPGRTWRPD